MVIKIPLPFTTSQLTFSTRLNSLPASLKLDRNVKSTGNDQIEEHSALRFILSGRLTSCYEMMYWTFVVDAIHGNLQNDPQLIAFAQKGFRLCVDKIESNESGFYRRHHGVWLMIRSCTRSALVLIGAARLDLKDLLPPDWEGKVHKVIEVLRYWSDEAKDVADRLDILECLMGDTISMSSTKKSYT